MPTLLQGPAAQRMCCCVNMRRSLRSRAPHLLVRLPRRLRAVALHPLHGRPQHGGGRRCQATDGVGHGRPARCAGSRAAHRQHRPGGAQDRPAGLGPGQRGPMQAGARDPLHAAHTRLQCEPLEGSLSARQLRSAGQAVGQLELMRTSTGCANRRTAEIRGAAAQHGGTQVAWRSAGRSRPVPAQIGACVHRVTLTAGQGVAPEPAVSPGQFEQAWCGPPG